MVWMLRKPVLPENENCPTVQNLIIPWPHAMTPLRHRRSLFDTKVKVVYAGTR